jgi:hypothetical protein
MAGRLLPFDRMSRWKSGAKSGRLGMAGLALAIVSLLVPRNTPANVTPVTLIDRQVIKPNLLILFDTSTSMVGAPGEKDIDSNEVGMDCQDGDDNCRVVGAVGRCYFAGTGAMGAGVRGDDTKCHNDAECRVGYCKNNAPRSCNQDTDCGGTVKCKGFCSNDNTRSCTGNTGCLSGGTCTGICSDDAASIPKCTTDADCNNGTNDNCTVFSNDTCTLAGTPAKSRLCTLGQNRCRSDADCPTSGDSCGPASSRMIVAKRVISGIVSSYYKTVNFALMPFFQATPEYPTAYSYYTYYPTTGTVTTTNLVRYLDRDQLSAYSCWTKQTGPSASCTLGGVTYTRRDNPNSRYKVRTGGDSFLLSDANWCNSLWCPVTGGTGHYQGSYYTFADPNATIDTSKPVLYKTSYLGKTITVGTTKYIYWDPIADWKNKGNVYGVNNGSGPVDTKGPWTNSCGEVSNGGLADSTVGPFMDTTNDPVKAQAMAQAILAKMDKAALGGLVASGYTPTGCSLSFGTSAAKTDYNNALSYMKKVKTGDTMPCRDNYVLLITDGNPNRGFDNSCESAACAAADPTNAGCQCQAVKGAQELAANGIKVFAVGFSSEMKTTKGQTVLNNIARAGGTGSAFFAVREQELEDAIVAAIYQAARGSYSTAPATASAGVEGPGGIQRGKMLLDTRVDFPGWRGNLIAYDTTTTPVQVAWNAATVSFDPAPTAAGPDFWKKRNVWTSNGSSMVKIQVDSSTGAILNKSALKALGLGADDAEAERVARWMLGDPALKNPAVLGALINSTPIDVGPPGKSGMPGGDKFAIAYKDRPSLVYVGSSDGMLHAFFSKATTINGTNFKAGQEAFAYLPQNMVPMALRLYSQGGQMPDPKDHIYGLANSAKVKDLCVANCTNADTASWKTVLAMSFGWGGTEAFMLDITNPFDTNGVKSSIEPVSLLWNTQYLGATNTGIYDNDLGLTTSVPAFYYAKGVDKNEFRLVFGSYTTEGATGQMAKVLINARTSDGAPTDTDAITPLNSCTQAFGLMSDVATARNYSATEEQQLMAAYFGDTWGNLYRYIPDVTGVDHLTSATGSVTLVDSFTCDHPVHYAPTVVQLDRDNSATRPGEIYLVQVTNSALDMDTRNLPASKMIFRKEFGTGAGSVTPDLSFGVGGKIELQAGVAAQLCGETSADGATCLQALPAAARPNSTPTAILRTDGQGFLVMATWYLPASNGCSDGITYLTVHELNLATGLKQRFAKKLVSEPITSTVFVDGKLMFAAQSGVTDLTPSLPVNLRFSSGSGGSGPRFLRTSWSEMP